MVIRFIKDNDLIDPKRIDPDTGLTNLELMQGKAPSGKNRAPIGPDGNPINLHHLIQTEDGAIAEVTQTFHQQHSKVLHINPSSIESGIDRNKFKIWRENYWKNRAQDFENGE